MVSGLGRCLLSEITHCSIEIHPAYAAAIRDPTWKFQTIRDVSQLSPQLSHRQEREDESMSMMYHQELLQQVQGVQSPDAFCTDWPTKWRAIAVSAQSVLNLLFPPGAIVLGFLITITDMWCKLPKAVRTPS
jgi:hypothetical protein